MHGQRISMLACSRQLLFGLVFCVIFSVFYVLSVLLFYLAVVMNQLDVWSDLMNLTFEAYILSELPYVLLHSCKLQCLFALFILVIFGYWLSVCEFGFLYLFVWTVGPFLIGRNDESIRCTRLPYELKFWGIQLSDLPIYCCISVFRYMSVVHVLLFSIAYVCACFYLTCYLQLFMLYITPKGSCFIFLYVSWTVKKQILTLTDLVIYLQMLCAPAP